MVKTLQRLLFRITEKLENQLWFFRYRENVQKGLLEVGRHTYGATKLRIDYYEGSESKVTIGSFCSIAPDVRILTGGIHPTNWVSLYPFRIMWQLPGALRDGTPVTKGPVIIGCDVWIGTGVTITSGVNIGHGAVLLAGAMVTSDIPSYAIAGGVPARIISSRFDEKTMGLLLEIAWWNWDEEELKTALPLLSSANIEQFISKYSKQ